MTIYHRSLETDSVPAPSDFELEAMDLHAGSNQLRRGDQIAYVPTHLQGSLPQQRRKGEAHSPLFAWDPRDAGIEFGFVTSISPDGIHAWCRFWHSGTPAGRLRTKANSERCDVTNLVCHVSVTDWIVQEALDRWCG